MPCDAISSQAPQAEAPIWVEAWAPSCFMTIEQQAAAALLCTQRPNIY